MHSGARSVGHAALLAAAIVAGCGGGSGERRAATTGHPSPAVPAPTGDPRARDFPAPGGRTLQQMAALATQEIQVAPATSVFTPGADRLAFGLIDSANAFVYGASAVYVARSPNARAQGPFVAPLDSMVVRPPFRSRTAAADPAEPKAVYAAQVRFDRPGSHSVLVLTRRRARLIGGATRIEVGLRSAVPAVGDRPPRVSTPTLAAVGGDAAQIDTRIPPDDMHAVDFRDVVGRRPVALLFATPALCQSRVCGPVVDVAAQLESRYGDRVAFIHQEVYVDNQLRKGLRPQLHAFHLQTEPWLFTFDRSGRVAARLEGAFGLREFEQALRRAIGTPG